MLINTKAPRLLVRLCLICGGHPLSHRRRQYHGRSRGLTSLFGMGRGEHPCYNRHQLFAGFGLLMARFQTILEGNVLEHVVANKSPARLVLKKVYRVLSTSSAECITTRTPAAYQRCHLQRPFKGSLILRRVSHLDAFSAYLFRTWIPSGTPGGMTGKPAVRPTRSSRTKVSPPQTS